jgi:hypothetical protein
VTRVVRLEGKGDGLGGLSSSRAAMFWLRAFLFGYNDDFRVASVWSSEL